MLFFEGTFHSSMEYFDSFLLLLESRTRRQNPKNQFPYFFFTGTLSVHFYYIEPESKWSSKARATAYRTLVRR